MPSGMHKQLQTNMGLMLVPKASFDVPAKCMAALIGVITVIIRGPNDPGRHRACPSQSRQTMLLSRPALFCDRFSTNE